MTPADIARMAREALEREVLLTPKPGLVDAANAGAHRDMDKDTFLRSAAALEPWFRVLAETGEQLAGQEPAAGIFSLSIPWMHPESNFPPRFCPGPPEKIIGFYTFSQKTVAITGIYGMIIVQNDKRR